MSGLPLIAPLFIEDGQFSSTLVLVSGTQLNTYADVTVRGMDLLGTSRWLGTSQAYTGAQTK
ncbi:MAG TPA: hypothetical protein VNO32_17175 [Candidatus Acidoferrum sp.]|nr:hypothetical protein [Candidatus Acidoferrum sp.]